MKKIQSFNQLKAIASAFSTDSSDGTKGAECLIMDTEKNIGFQTYRFFWYPDERVFLARGEQGDEKFLTWQEFFDPSLSFFGKSLTEGGFLYLGQQPVPAPHLCVAAGDLGQFTFDYYSGMVMQDISYLNESCALVQRAEREGCLEQVTPVRFDYDRSAIAPQNRSDMSVLDLSKMSYMMQDGTWYQPNDNVLVGREKAALENQNILECIDIAHQDSRRQFRQFLSNAVDSLAVSQSVLSKNAIAKTSLHLALASGSVAIAGAFYEAIQLEMLPQADFDAYIQTVETHINAVKASGRSALLGYLTGEIPSYGLSVAVKAAAVSMAASLGLMLETEDEGQRAEDRCQTAEDVEPDFEMGLRR